MRPLTRADPDASEVLQAVEIGHGVHAATVVTWGFDDLEPGVERGYRAAVTARLPGVTLLDGQLTTL